MLITNIDKILKENIILKIIIAMIKVLIKRIVTIKGLNNSNNTNNDSNKIWLENSNIEPQIMRYIVKELFKVMTYKM